MRARADRFRGIFPALLTAAISLSAIVPLQAGPEDVPHATAQPIAEDKLAEAIEKVIEQPEYAWRAPREKRNGGSGDEDEQENFLESWFQAFDDMLKSLARKARRLADKIDEWFRPGPRDFGGRRLGDFDPRILWGIAALIIIAAVVIVVIRLWREKGRRVVVDARAAAPMPDITREDVMADELPSDEWLRMAEDFIQREEWRLALRALFLSCLAHLGRERAITIARFKSNREYQRELQRRHRDRPELQEAFNANVRSLEDVWYGNHEAGEETMVTFRQRQEAIMATLDQPATREATS